MGPDMERLHRDILEELRTKIVDDLDVYNVIIQLTSEQVLRNEEVLKIKSGRTKERRAQILLEILPSCGPHAFDIFHGVLRHHYSWLSHDIDNSLRRRRVDVIDMGRNSPGSPNLPPQSPMTVTRKAKMDQLKSALTTLVPGGYLALHGMKGFGKSCLTANTLKDPSLVNDLFTNQVYWIKFGYERSIEDEILIQLNFLYHQVRNADSLNSTLNSEPLKEHLIHYLRHHFGKRNHRNALLILDDVWNREIIDAFDFHCKTLVITTDIDFLDGKQRDIIEMKDGFTESESLGLFAKSLGTDVDKLPTEAQLIHQECNGMPILIAMFAAHFEEFKDEMNTSPQKWKYYLRSLRNKDSSNRLVNKFLSKQNVIFDMCIGKLDDDIKAKYEALAIFSEDVNIMPQTLEILWDLDPLTDPDSSHKIADDMVILCHKSLAAKHWNVDLKSYVYGVHDLLLCHLRRKLTPEKLKELHKSFIDKYRKYCKGDFSKLPRDNYSYSYIGHHLEQSGLYDEFPKLYLDFDFIREKIYHTGLSDVLIDLKKYRKLITGNTEEGETKVKDLETFLENQAGIIAEHRRRECLDLVQIGINHSSMGYVHQKSCELAKAQSTNLYVIHNNIFTPMQNHIPTSEEVSTDVKSAFFTDDPEKFLIGNHSGEVILWDCKTRRQSVFLGHNKKTAILKIIVNSDEYFLTLSEDGEMKLFEMRNDEHSNGLARTPTRVQSPREKQTFWSGLFSASKDNSNVTFSIENEKITDMVLSDNEAGPKRIAVCTEQGTMQILSIEGEAIYTEKVKGHSFERVAFTRKGSMVQLLDSAGVLIFYVEQFDSSYSYVATYNPNLRNRKVIFFQAVPKNERSLMIVTDVNAIYVKWHETYDRRYPKRVEHVHSFLKQERAKIEEDETAFTCATFTYDGEYFVTADSKGSINVWFIDSGTQPVATFKGRVNSLDTYWLDEEYHLICGSEDRVIHRWTLALAQLPKSVRKPLFDAVMKPWGDEDIVAKETINRIVIYNGDTMVAQTEPVEGSIIRLSLNSKGNKIVYATDKGVVTLFDLEAKTTTEMRLEPNATPGIVTFITINGSTVVVCGENNNLKVWFHNITAKFEDTGHVLSIHTSDNEYIITVARNGAVTFWSVRPLDEPTRWLTINLLQSCTENESVCYSCLSPNKKLLTVLKANGEMIIYDIIKDDTVEPAHIDTDIVTKFLFDQKVSCCEYSQDDNYLAIGLENGDISIYDIFGRNEISRLQLHCNEVRQLHWSPTSLGAPILLSVNCDELAWWNVDPLLSQKKENRRSRMGMSRSITNIGFSPRSSGRLSVSQSLDLTTSGALARELRNMTSQPSNADSSTEHESDNQGNESNRDCLAYWKNKSAKHENRIALLSVVPLPPSCNSKVSVSDDFRKFLSVDIHGFVSNFRLYNDT